MAKETFGVCSKTSNISTMTKIVKFINLANQNDLVIQYKLYCH